MNEELKSYRIIALATLPPEVCIGCSIIPSDAQYDAIYSSVYGPASQKNCEQWRHENCGQCACE